MATNPLNVTSLSNTQLKQSLIEFIEAKPEWSNVDYEGSAINTIADLLVYNAQKTGYQANMVANESFLDTAQIRANIVSHAQKLSYVPKSTTAARLECTIEVTPPQGVTPQTNIVLDAGTTFIAQSDDESFTFVNTESYVLTYSAVRGTYQATGVVLYQGQLIEESYLHIQKTKINIQNSNCDSSTIQVAVDNAPYTKAQSIDELGSQQLVYFLGENIYQQSQIEFGRDILGVEPVTDANVTIRYVATEDNHANGLSNVIAASPIANLSNITVDVTTPAYGGSNREDKEVTRYLAPKIYQSQDRALTDTDYVPILRKQFPFVRSAISWGGETNNPPAYGTVFLSLLSDQGLITNSIKQQMVSYLSSRNVGSVTPTILDPVNFKADLVIKFSYDDRITSKTYNDLVTQINTVVDNYNEMLSEFEEFLNPSELVTRIKAIVGVTSVDVDKVVHTQLDILNFENPVYTVNFDNPIIPQSLDTKEDLYKLPDAESGIRLKDDGESNVIAYYTDTQNVLVENTVGTIDYETGEIEFTINIIPDSEGENVFSIYVTPQEENFYVTQNRVIEIDQKNFELINTKTRTTVSTIQQQVNGG